jgi:hypothetical protein
MRASRRGTASNITDRHLDALAKLLFANNSVAP